MSISKKSTSYLFNIHFKNKKIHEMQKIFLEMDFSRGEKGGRAVLGVFRTPLEQVFLRKVAYRFYNLTRCKFLVSSYIILLCVRCEENFPNSCCNRVGVPYADESSDGYFLLLLALLLSGYSDAGVFLYDVSTCDPSQKTSAGLMTGTVLL